MSLEVKARIKYNPNTKPSMPQYTLECPQLEINCEGSGNLVQMIDEITELIRREVVAEFTVAPSLVQVVGYSMGLTFAIDGPVNRTPYEFTATIETSDGKKIPLEKLAKAAKKPGQVLDRARAAMTKQDEGAD